MRIHGQCKSLPYSDLYAYNSRCITMACMRSIKTAISKEDTEKVTTAWRRANWSSTTIFGKETTATCIASSSTTSRSSYNKNISSHLYTYKLYKQCLPKEGGCGVVGSIIFPGWRSVMTLFHSDSKCVQANVSIGSEESVSGWL